MFKKLPLKTILNYIAVFTIFTSSWSYNIGLFAYLRISYLIMLILLVLWVPILKDIHFNRSFFLFYLVIVLFSLINVVTGNNTILLLSKQAVGILLNSLWFYILIKINNYDEKRLFKIYLNFAFVIALIGIFQEISYIVRFKAGYDYRYLFNGFWNYTPSGIFWEESLKRGWGGILRVNSILPEPIGFCIVLIPAIFTSVVSFTRNKVKLLNKPMACVIILSFLLTFSIIGYIGIFLSFLLILSKRIKVLLIFLSTVCMVSIILYVSVLDFRYKINDSVQVLTNKLDLEMSNTSTYALFSNALIAFNSFKDSPLFGNGLGSYESNYKKYIHKVVNLERFVSSRDANSLFLRLLSETGLFGVIIFLLFLFKYFIRINNKEAGYLWIINNGIFVMLVLRFIRVGHYFIDGFFFFFWLYYFSKIKHKNQIEIKNISS